MSRRIAILTTGGTIEKTYDERSGELSNRRSIVPRMLQRLRLEDTAVEVRELMSKDSLFMTDDDRRLIARAVGEALDGPATGVVILHGTDTLCTTGDLLVSLYPTPRVPIVLTGAMRPFEMRRSDALQNLTEAIFATGTLPPGVYAVSHGRAIPFPGVAKNRDRGTFERTIG